MTGNESQACHEAGRLSTSPHKVETGGLYVIPTASGYQTIDLTGDKYREFPSRKKGVVTAGNVASFAQYYAKHADDGSEVFADLDDAEITAVLDAHFNSEDFEPEAGARWQEHRLRLVMRKTPQWVAWTRADNALMKQDTFAQFIEDHADDVNPRGPVSAADLLEIAQSFQAHTKVTFSSGKRLASGMTELVYAEDINASAGKGTIKIPAEFELALRPFEDCDPYLVKARFRYRIEGGSLALGYHLHDPEGTFRDAVLQISARVAEACGVTVMIGTPS